MFRKHSSTLTLSSDFIHIFPNYPCRSMPGSGAPIKPRARWNMKVTRPTSIQRSHQQLSCSTRKCSGFMPQVAQRCNQNLRLQGPRLAGSFGLRNERPALVGTCVQPRFCTLQNPYNLTVAPFSRIVQWVWPERCNWCWLQHHVHGSCCNFKSHLEGFTCEASRVSNSATLMQKKTWPSFFTPVIQVAPNTIHTPCWLGSSISQRQALLEPQGQSPEVAINFHGSVHRPCWNLWKDCSFTSLQHPFVAFEVEGYLQIRTPRPKQLTHLKCCFSRI